MWISRSARLALVAVLCAGIGTVLAMPVAAGGALPDHVTAPGTTELLTHRADGSPTGRPSNDPAISGDGEWSAFASQDNHLVAGEPIRGVQVYLTSASTGEVQLVSRALNGKGGNGTSWEPRVSDDGRYVAFTSFAHNLTPRGHRLDGYAAFVADMGTGTISLLAAGPAGGPARGDSSVGDISADGRFVLFDSEAPHLVPRDDNDVADAFLLDRDSDTLTLVSHTQAGRAARGSSEAQSLSADGSVATITSYADNLVSGPRIKSPRYPDIYAHHADTGELSMVSRSMEGNHDANKGAGGSVLSADGSHVVFFSESGDIAPGDADDNYDVFLTDLASGETILVSRAADGGPSNGSSTYASVSADGSVVTFGSDASNLVEPPEERTGDLFRTVVATGATQRLTDDAYGDFYNEPVSALTNDGRSVVFVARRPLVDDDQNGVDDLYRWSAR